MAEGEIYGRKAKPKKPLAKPTSNTQFEWDDTEWEVLEEKSSSDAYDEKEYNESQHVSTTTEPVQMHMEYEEYPRYKTEFEIIHEWYLANRSTLLTIHEENVYITVYMLGSDVKYLAGSKHDTYHHIHIANRFLKKIHSIDYRLSSTKPIKKNLPQGNTTDLEQPQQYEPSRTHMSYNQHEEQIPSIYWDKQYYSETSQISSEDLFPTEKSSFSFDTFSEVVRSTKYRIIEMIKKVDDKNNFTTETK